MNLNKIFLIGRASDTPELKSLSTNVSVTNFSLATNRNWTDKEGNKQEETEWHRIVFFGKLAEVAASFISKGSIVMIEGRLQTRSWTDKEGNKRQTTEIIGEALQLGPKPQGTVATRSPANEDKVEEVTAEDLPF